MDHRTLKNLEDDYFLKKAVIDEKYRDMLKNLNKKFSAEHKRFSVGDKIQDKAGIKIKIDDIHFGFCFGYKFPCATYIGTMLKKDGTKRKDGQQHIIFDIHAEKANI